jgi:eukaryotic-like serine/threonine-protein kinase
MLDQETINGQRELLAAHRRTLAVYLRQQAELGVLAPPGVVNGIAETQSTIRRIKEQLRADGVPVEDEPNDEVQPATVAPPSRLSPQEQRNRSRMLDKVEAFWVKGVLDQSLYQMARLELAFEHAPAQVSHPWESVLQQANQPNQSIPAGKPIVAVFDDLLGELLILGAPGAGKTTMLLELTRDLIARARNNEQHPIPVVFNLSTWATKRQPLGNWLTEELNQRYDVPRKLAQDWVAVNAILPLLDGLDEVAAEHRDACVAAINDYRTEVEGFVPVAVCSRIADYRALTRKLRLQGAIVIQPLSKPQVDEYLKGVGRPLAAVRAALGDDPTPWELMDSPLMLSIVALAYQHLSAAKLGASGTPEHRRRQLFDDYIAAMFARPGRSKGTAAYTQHQAVHSLSWLAAQMLAHHQTVLYIERMQPEWLPQAQQRGYVVRMRLLFGLLTVLLGGLGFGLLMGLVFGLFTELLNGLLYGLVGGLGFGLLMGLLNELLAGRGYGQLVDLLFGLGVGRLDQIGIVETFRWSWQAVRSRWRLVLNFGLFGGLLGGLLVGLLVGLFTGLLVGLLVGLLSGLLAGLVFGLLGGLGVGLVPGELVLKATPNQGIRRSARSALFLGLGSGLGVGPLIGLLVGLLVGLFTGPLIGLLVGLLVGLGSGLSFGLFLALRNGGFAVLQHYTLRWLLYRNGYLSLRLVPFLDYCADRIFLRKVGGEYIFVHRLLMEHFASLSTEGKPTEPVEASQDASTP